MAGVQLILNHWFLLLLLFFGLTGTGGKVLLVFIAVLWHELSHAYVAALLGYRTLEIELLPFGGVARIEHLGEAGTGEETVVALAGPLGSLLMAAFCYIVMALMIEKPDLGEFYIRVNVMLALFNLLPALPLDGGRIVRVWLAVWQGYSPATKLMVLFSKVISLLLLGWIVIDYQHRGMVNVTFLTASLFIWFASQQEIQQAGFRVLRLLAKKKARLGANGILPTMHYITRENVQIRDVIRVFGADHYAIVVVVNDRFQIKGSLTETELLEAMSVRGLFAAIGDFLA